MEKLPEVIAALEDSARELLSTARTLRRASPKQMGQASHDLLALDRMLLELHNTITHVLSQEPPVDTPMPAPVAGGEIELDELTRVLYRSINPPESRRNYTYTPPFSIERVLRAYLMWTSGPGKGVNVRE